MGTASKAKVVRDKVGHSKYNCQIKVISSYLGFVMFQNFDKSCDITSRVTRLGKISPIWLLFKGAGYFRGEIVAPKSGNILGNFFVK
jgi:hypothetical protein